MRSGVRNIGWCAVLAVGLLARPAAADTPISEEARQHFAAGVAHLQDPDGARYAEAYQEFLAAYAASPSWKILGNLGIAAMKLERDGEAADAFARYLQEGGDQIDPSEREQITRDLATLRASLSTVSVETAPPGVVLIDERIPPTGNSIVNRYGPLQGPTRIGIKGGKHRITAQLDGHVSQVWELDAKPGAEQQHKFELQVTPAPTTSSGAGSVTLAPPPAGDRGKPGLRIASYAALGVGVIGLAGGTFFALRAKSKADEAEDLCGGDLSACALDAGSAQAERVSTLNDDSGSSKTLGLVGLGIGGVGIAAGITLLVLSSSSSSEQAESAPAPRVMPWVGYKSAGVVGRF